MSGPALREPAARGELAIAVRPADVLRVLAWVIGVLAVTGLIANRLIYAVAPDLEHPLARAAYRFDLGLEPSVPAFYSALVLTACAALLWVNGRAERTVRDRWDWWLLAIVFVALAIDESVMIHEMANDTLQRLLGTGGPLFFAWIIPGALFAGAVAAFSLRLLRRLDPRARRLFVAAGGLFVGGAIGMEMLAGPIVQAHGAESLEHALEQVVEESLEMAGALVFLFALLDRLERTAGTIRVTIGGPR